jgi:hypothetical protein
MDGGLSSNHISLTHRLRLRCCIGRTTTTMTTAHCSMLAFGSASAHSAAHALRRTKGATTWYATFAGSTSRGSWQSHSGSRHLRPSLLLPQRRRSHSRSLQLGETESVGGRGLGKWRSGPIAQVEVEAVVEAVAVAVAVVVVVGEQKVRNVVGARWRRQCPGLPDGAWAMRAHSIAGVGRDQEVAEARAAVAAAEVEEEEEKEEGEIRWRW